MKRSIVVISLTITIVLSGVVYAGDAKSNARADLQCAPRFERPNPNGHATINYLKGEEAWKISGEVKNLKSNDELTLQIGIQYSVTPHFNVGEIITNSEGEANFDFTAVIPGSLGDDYSVVRIIDPERPNDQDFGGTLVMVAREDGERGSLQFSGTKTVEATPRTASEANNFNVTVTPESSTTLSAGYLFGYQSESDDSLAPFGGQSVMFEGFKQPGGATEMRKDAYLVCRYKIEFDRDVTFDSVTVTGAGDNNSTGNSAVLRLLDESMNEISVEPLTGFNTLLKHTLNTGGVLGRIFYIDEFDYSTIYRYRKNIEIAYH